MGYSKKHVEESDPQPNYGQLLNENSQGGDLLVQLLNALGIQSNGTISGTDRKDWNKQLLDTLVSHQSTLENRQYNESLRDEQRIYDNPMSQLARLMGAGISRDQALQMISAGGGSGSGAGVPYSQASQAAQGIPPSQSDLNHTQAQMAKIQTGLGFVQAVSGLVSLGFSAAQAVPQIKMLKNSAYLTEKQRQAFDDSSTAFRIISNAGVEINDKTFGSVQSVQDTIFSLMNNGNKAAQEFMRSGGMYRLRDNSPYSLPFLNQLYKNEKEPDFYNKQVNSALRYQAAETNLANFTSNKVLAEINEINEQINNLDADTRYKDGLTALLSWQQRLFGAQTDVQNETANSIRLSNAVEGAFQNYSADGTSGLDLMTTYRYNTLVRGLSSINAEIGSKVWESQVKTFLSEQENLRASYALSTMYKKGMLDVVNNGTPKFQQNLFLVGAMEELGVSDYLNAVVNAETSGHIGSQFYQSSMPSNKGLDLLDSLDPQKESLIERFKRIRKEHRDR